MLCGCFAVSWCEIGWFNLKRSAVHSKSDSLRSAISGIVQKWICLPFYILSDLFPNVLDE